MSNSKVKTFPPEVADKLGCYVYRLVDPRDEETFYVGKGQGDRVFQHLKASLRTLKNEEDNEDETDLKYQRIKDILDSGQEVLHVIHRHGLSEEEAFHVEAALLDAYPDLTNKAGGRYSGDIGPMTADDIMAMYRAKDAELKHNALLIIINRTKDEKGVYDAVRYAWRLNPEKAGQADYVLAVEKGLIVGAFKPAKWLEATKKNFPDLYRKGDGEGRYGFVGEAAEAKIQNMYVGMRIPEKYRKKGASNPIKYTY